MVGIFDLDHIVEGGGGGDVEDGDEEEEQACSQSHHQIFFSDVNLSNHKRDTVMHCGETEI